MDNIFVIEVDVTDDCTYWYSVPVFITASSKKEIEDHMDDQYLNIIENDVPHGEIKLTNEHAFGFRALYDDEGHREVKVLSLEEYAKEKANPIAVME